MTVPPRREAHTPRHHLVLPIYSQSEVVVQRIAPRQAFDHRCRVSSSPSMYVKDEHEYLLRWSGSERLQIRLDRNRQRRFTARIVRELAYDEEYDCAERCYKCKS